MAIGFRSGMASIPVSMLCLSLLHAAFMVKTASAQEQVEACWFSYVDCSRQAGGDPQWRSVCYADFASCVGRKPMPECSPSTGTETCNDFKRECTEFADDEPRNIEQCNDDFEVCLFAHGC